jgi:aspartate racemase
MKRIGLVGGVSWMSTAYYYSLINEEIGQRLGGLNSASIAMVSLNFEEVRRCVDSGDEEALVHMYGTAAKQLENAGADVLALCSNAAHRRIDRLQALVDKPFIHIADAVGAAVRAAGIHRVGLLGTRETMGMPFMRNCLEERGNLAVDVPGAADQNMVHSAIFDSVRDGVTVDVSADLNVVIGRLANAGCEGVVLGCTELPLLLEGMETVLPCFDSARLHAIALVEHALNFS